MPKPLTKEDQFGMLLALQYLSDLFTGAGKETFTRVEVLTILNDVKNDPELIDPDTVIAFDGLPEPEDE
jgi:hypothetical protein